MSTFDEITQYHNIDDEVKNLNEVDQYILQSSLSTETAITRYRLYTLARLSGRSHSEGMKSIHEYDSYVMIKDGKTKSRFRQYTKDGQKIDWSGIFGNDDDTDKSVPDIDTEDLPF